MTKKKNQDKNELVIPTDIKAEHKAAKKATKKEAKQKAKNLAAAGTPDKKQTKLILKLAELGSDIDKLNKERNRIDSKHAKEVNKNVAKLQKKSKKLADVQAALEALKNK